LSESILKEIVNLQERLQQNLDCLDDMIKSHGKVIALHSEDKTTDDLVHDYIFLCITKGLRTLNSVDLLLTEGQFEDSTILMRASYECYLNGAYVYNDNQKVHELLLIKLGLYSGTLEHPLRNNGKPKRQKVVIPETGEHVDYGISIAEMANNTSSEYDSVVHTPFYKFLSEFVHVHIMSSGSYRTEDHQWYTSTSSPYAAFYTITNSLYISWLLLDITIDYLHDKGVNVFHYDMELNFSRELLTSTVQNMGFADELKSLKTDMLSRLSEE